MKTYNYTLNDKSLDSLIDFPVFEKEKNILIQIFCGEKKEVLEKILNEITNKLLNNMLNMLIELENDYPKNIQIREEE